MTLNASSTPAGNLLVAAAALTDAHGRVLMQRRPPGTAHAGLWEFPGGKLEPGETALDALARELDEELGIAIDRAACAPVTFACGEGGGRAIVLLLFRCTAWTGTPRALHASEFAWSSPADHAARAMPPLDVALLAALR